MPIATASDPALDRDNHPATRGYVYRLVEKVAIGLGEEMGRTELAERQRSAAALGALETLVAEMEARYLADVSALRAELAEMRSEIERIKQAAPPQLRVVSS